MTANAVPFDSRPHDWITVNGKNGSASSICRRCGMWRISHESLSHYYDQEGNTVTWPTFQCMTLAEQWEAWLEHQGALEQIERLKGGAR